MTIAILLMATIGTAEAKKGKKVESKQEPTAEKVVVKAQAKANIPSDANSKNFAKSLLSKSFTEFSPDVESLIYRKLQFKSDNTWTTEAAVVTLEVEMDCVESGTWTLDPAESASTAILNLKLESTDCPSRESGETIRFKATIRGSQLDPEFR